MGRQRSHFKNSESEESSSSSASSSDSRSETGTGSSSSSETSSSDSTTGDSESDSSSSSDSSSATTSSSYSYGTNEPQNLKQLLVDLKLGKYIRNLKKQNLLQKRILSYEALKAAGIKSSDDAKAILKGMKRINRSKNLSTRKLSSVVARVCRNAGLKDWSPSIVMSKNIRDLDDLYRLKEKHLGKLGMEDADERRHFVRALREHKKTNISLKLDKRNETDLDKIYKVLRKNDLLRIYNELKDRRIHSLKRIKQVDHKFLKEIGLADFNERRTFMDAFSNYEGQYITSSSSETVSESTGTSSEEQADVVQQILERTKLLKYKPEFDKAKIRTLKQGRKLSHTQLRSMGVKYYLEREKLIHAFEDYRPRNKSIVRVLKRAYLLRYREAFSKLCDIEEAQELTHEDLERMGISLHGQRERLLNYFHEYVPHKDRIADKKRYRKEMKRKRVVGHDINFYTPVEEVLIQEGLKKCLGAFKGVKTLREARKLTHDELRSKGIGLSGTRERLLKAFNEAYLRDKR